MIKYTMKDGDKMENINKIKLKDYTIDLYYSIEDKSSIRLFLINDGDIFIKHKESIINNELKNIIIAFIYSNDRLSEYTPWKENIYREEYPFSGEGNLYIEFLLRDLKPFIEEKIGKKIANKNTFIAGASLGGLISLYAISQYPDSFGGAICISSSFWYDNFIDYLDNKNNYNLSQKIYIDVGNREGKGKITLFRDVVEKTKKVYRILLEKGFKEENIKFIIQEDMSHRSDFFVDRLSDGINFLQKNKLE